MTERNDGMEMHATETGKIAFVCRKDGESLLFPVQLEQAKAFRDDLNRAIAELEQQNNDTEILRRKA